MLCITKEKHAKLERQAENALRGNDFLALAAAAHAIECVMHVVLDDWLIDPLFQLAERLSENPQYTQQSLEAYLFVLNKSHAKAGMEQKAIAGFTRVFVEMTITQPELIPAVRNALNAHTQPVDGPYDFCSEARARSEELESEPEVPTKRSRLHRANKKNDLG